jgi:hypothetical protein
MLHCSLLRSPAQKSTYMLFALVLRLSSKVSFAFLPARAPSRRACCDTSLSQFPSWEHLLSSCDGTVRV